MRIREREAAKYKDIWQIPEYHQHSPGAELVPWFVDQLELGQEDIICDFGCGDGAATRAMRQRGLTVIPVDIVQAGLEGFEQRCLWGRDPLPRGTVGLCADVMEHIPEALTMLAARNMVDACRAKGVLFQVSFVNDALGAAINDTLHLTVRPFDWWRDHLAEVGKLVEARDLIGRGVFVVK